MLLVPRAKIGAAVRSIRKESRNDETGGIGVEAVLHVSEGRHVVIHTESASDDPRSILSRIPRETEAGRPDIPDWLIQHVVLLLHDSTCDLVVESGSRAEMEIGQNSSLKRDVGIPEIVPAKAIDKSQVRFDLPRIFREDATDRALVSIISLGRLAGNGIVCQTRLAIRRVLDQVKQIIELKAGLIVRTGEIGQVISVPALIAETQSVGTSNVRQDVAPMIAVLNEVAKRETVAERCNSIDADRRNREQSGLRRNSFHSQKRKASFVQRVGTESVGFVDLQ